MMGVSEYDMVEDFRYPTEVTLVKRLFGFSDNHVCATHKVDIAFSPLRGYVLPEMGWITIEPPEIALIDGLYVVVDRTVVAAGIPAASVSGSLALRLMLRIKFYITRAYLIVSYGRRIGAR
jgi:hypothetical protein